MGATIIKRDGREVEFDRSKIVNAIYKAAQSVGGTDENLANTIADLVIFRMASIGASNGDKHKVEDIQDYIEKELIEEGHARTAKAFILYRQKRSEARQMQSNLTKTIEDLIFKTMDEVEEKRENANINGDTMCGTIMKVYDAVMTRFNIRHIFNDKQVKMIDSGAIYSHDNSLSSTAANCIYLPVDKLLRDGFGTGHGSLRSPTTIGAAATLTCIIVQSDQNDMFKHH